MRRKVIFHLSLLILFLTIFASNALTKETKVFVKNDTKTFTHQIKVPIFSKPTISDMKVCNDKREKCLSKCDYKKNATCEDFCPICPIIREVPYILKGLNESKIESSPKTQNFTAVIRMKNIIHTSIENAPPPRFNITNLNNVNILKNMTSYNGGKYGYGFSKDGPCCIETHPKTCSMTPFGPKCYNKRHRTCGEHCTSGSIHRRKVRICYSGTCEIQVRYIPQPDVSKCKHMNTWPFLNCGETSNDCQDCFEIFNDNDPDAMVPRRCISCFAQNIESSGSINRGSISGSTYYNSNFDGSYDKHDADVETDFKPSEWRIQARKCRRQFPNGTLEITNCEDIPFENDEFLQNALKFSRNVKGPNSRRQRRRTESSGKKNLNII